MMIELQKQNAFFRQLLFLAMLITIGVIIFKQLSFFLGALLGAITLYLVLRPVLFKLTDQFKQKRWVAATILLIFATVFLLAVGFLVYEVIASEIPQVDTSVIVDKYNSLLKQVNDWTGMDIKPARFMQSDQTTGFVAKLASSILNTTYSFALNTFMMLVLLYFMLLHARKMEEKVFLYAPFKGRSMELLKTEFKNMIFSNAVGIPVILIAQGITSGLIYWLFGLTNVVFWAFLTAICGLIPMIGTALVTVPMGVYMIATGDVWQGALLIFCGLFVIANADNVVRIILLKKAANVHPLIVIFGVILGIPLFGFWGIIFGPLLISGFILLIRIYYVEYRLIDPKRVTAEEMEEIKEKKQD